MKIVKSFLTFCVAALMFSSCVSLTKVNYPSGALVTQAPWQPKLESTVDNKPLGQIRYSRWSFFIPLSIDEGLKEAVNKAGGKTLTSVAISPYSFSWLLHSLIITGEISKR